MKNDNFLCSDLLLCVFTIILTMNVNQICKSLWLKWPLLLYLTFLISCFVKDKNAALLYVNKILICVIYVHCFDKYNLKSK